MRVFLKPCSRKLTISKNTLFRGNKNNNKKSLIMPKLQKIIIIRIDYHHFWENYFLEFFSWEVSPIFSQIRLILNIVSKICVWNSYFFFKIVFFFNFQVEFMNYESIFLGWLWLLSLWLSQFRRSKFRFGFRILTKSETKKKFHFWAQNSQPGVHKDEDLFRDPNKEIRNEFF